MSAQVKSIDAIDRMRTQSLEFAHRVDDALVSLEGEMRRFIEWLEHDRPRFWKEQVRKAFDAVGVAKGDLHRCLMYPVLDERPSCTEERGALKKAQAFLAHCEEKAERQHVWARQVRHELHEYQGRISRLKEVVAEDAPQAAAALGRLLVSLDNYTASRLTLENPSSNTETGITPAPTTEQPTSGDAAPEN